MPYGKGKHSDLIADTAQRIDVVAVGVAIVLGHVANDQTGAVSVTRRVRIIQPIVATLTKRRLECLHVR